MAPPATVNPPLYVSTTATATAELWSLLGGAPFEDYRRINIRALSRVRLWDGGGNVLL